MIFLFNWVIFWFQPLIFRGADFSCLHLSWSLPAPQRRQVTFLALLVLNFLEVGRLERVILFGFARRWQLRESRKARTMTREKSCKHIHNRQLTSLPSKQKWYTTKRRVFLKTNSPSKNKKGNLTLPFKNIAASELHGGFGFFQVEFLVQKYAGDQG